MTASKGCADDQSPEGRHGRQNNSPQRHPHPNYGTHDSVMLHGKDALRSQMELRLQMELGCSSADLDGEISLDYSGGTNEIRGVLITWKREKS